MGGNAIPWYRSPVYIGAITSLVTQVLVLIGVADKIAPGDVAKYVDAVLQLCALGGAALAWWKRQRSDVQPLTLTKKSAEEKNRGV